MRRRFSSSLPTSTQAKATRASPVSSQREIWASRSRRSRSSASARPRRARSTLTTSRSPRRPSSAARARDIRIRQPWSCSSGTSSLSPFMLPVDLVNVRRVASFIRSSTLKSGWTTWFVNAWTLKSSARPHTPYDRPEPGVNRGGWIWRRRDMAAPNRTRSTVGPYMVSYGASWAMAVEAIWTSYSLIELM
ncbi:hypothetical protein C8F01DRAFT_266162 [Mycena amicta]|nr:hypothetical protein C8F01DRAFT_266162 [Mycena amicta]